MASNGGIPALTRVLAKEAGDFNVTVNSIAPGNTASDLGADQATYEVRTAARPVKRIEVPEDFTGTGVFIMSSESDFMTAQTMVVDGSAVMN